MFCRRSGFLFIERSPKRPEPIQGTNYLQTPIKVAIVQRVLDELAHQLRWALPIWVLRVGTAWWPDNRITCQLRGALHRPFLGKCGSNFQLARGVTILNPHRIEIGRDVYISYHAWLNGLGGLFIDDEVVIGPYVSISTLTHSYKNGSFRFAGARGAPVRVGRGSWLGAHVSVSCGVSIGSGSLIGANAAVTRDVPDGMLAGGVPAKAIQPCRESKNSAGSRWEYERVV
jgi:maltose O-acetyltransferase